MADERGSTEQEFVRAAFGARNRSRLIAQYFSSQPTEEVTPATSWVHVYRLLLWADQTTGLAHCYESDKCQPGKNWYARSLAFHDWVSRALNVAPSDFAIHIDWLFRRATADLASEVLRRSSRVSAQATRQRQPFEGRGLPNPGEDPELVAIVRDVLGHNLTGEPTANEWQLLVQRIRQHLSLENKRKNLVGEGFEDVLAHVIEKTTGNASIVVRTRTLLHEIPGFSLPRRGEKPNKVDIAIVHPNMRTLVTAKWSVRADREKQFATEFGEYVNAECDSKPFKYVFVTNEFDPARLMRACEKLASNAPMFSHVVHINTDGLRAAYGNAPEESMRRVLQYIERERLIGLEKWIELLRNH